MDAPKRRLVLHFDLNKTITMRGENFEKDAEEAIVRHMVNTMAWGRIDKKEKDKVVTNIWVCAHDGLAKDCPDENLINYQYIGIL